jgi:hypothetical protein
MYQLKKKNATQVLERYFPLYLIRERRLHMDFRHKLKRKKKNYHAGSETTPHIN